MQLSFEFFPPKTEAGLAKLANTAARLAGLSPAYVSVTYGAGGSTRDGTEQTVLRLLQQGLAVAPHLSLGNDEPELILAMLERYRDAGVRRIVALRGDIPSGLGTPNHENNAARLVRLIRDHFGDTFLLEVAAYPETHPDSESPETDLEHFAHKVACGADGAITQYFYNVEAYRDYVVRARAAGVEIPIIPGIMPITNYDGLVRFSNRCGADIPRWLQKRLLALNSDEAALRAFGLDVVTRLCEQLLSAGAPGLHFYTLNAGAAPLEICARLGFVEAAPSSAA